MTNHSLHRASLWTPLLVGVLLTGCGDSPETRRERAREILTARTVGLAYLEENKLAEAEAEFLKLIELAPDEVLGYADLGLVYLRMGRYEDAERRVREALDRAPADPDVRLILAKVYELTGREAAAVAELETTLATAPDHVKTRHAAAELLGRSDDPDTLRQAAEHLAVVVRERPANSAVRLELLETLVRTGQADAAVVELEQLRQIVPALPDEAVPFFEQALTLLRRGQTDEALRSTITLHNFLKATSIYQADAIELRGPGGALIGFPVITFHQDLSLQPADEAAVLAAIRFADVTADVGLDTIRVLGDARPSAVTTNIIASDYDHDEDQDLLVVTAIDGRSDGSVYLLRNDLGTFIDATTAAGLPRSGTSVNAAFADYDNDGQLDLYLVNSGPDALFANAGDGTFQDVTAAAGIADRSPGRAAVFLDADHDGDLDAYVVTDGPNRFYRNNADGTFVEQAQVMGLAGRPVDTRDAVFGDFDDDGDIDLLTANDGASNALFSNQRQSRFGDVTASVGLAGDQRTRTVSAADYDNDGFLDLFVGSATAGGHRFYRNRTDGSFEPDTRSRVAMQVLNDLVVLDADYFDFDNDGFQDLLVIGTDESGSRSRVLLLRNAGPGQFTDFSHLLAVPASFSPASAAVMDYGNDGDLDVALAGRDGTVRLFRNDGGNANHYLKMTLVGLTSGSGKNNYFGIGAKLEVRAGDLYQLRTVTQPSMHLGLGGRLKADVVRIVWTNGVPQNVFFPGGDQDLLEQQILKGSCAFLYTWDGEAYTFVKDVMWKSAIGMPVGIMGGGSRAYAPPDASREYLKIPGDRLQPRDGTYTLQFTEELWEVAYVDEIKLLAVDHPDSVEVYVDEKFVPPGPATLRLYHVTDKRYPVAARDERGVDLLPRLRQKDDRYVDNLTPARFQGITTLHDLVLDLGEVSPKDSLHLFLQGWLFPTDASINVAMAQSPAYEAVAPYVQIPDARGRWQTVIPNMSFPSGKDKTVVVDLTGAFPTSDYRVRIRTNMEIYWDHVFFTQPQAPGEARITTLAPERADLHYRGFSRLFRKGGRHGPHWFDYQDVTEESPWLAIGGTYTRYGTVQPLLSDADDRYAIMAPGDEITISFDAETSPSLPAGWTRDFLLYSVGWIKDADINTATGATVEPLPFHRMSRYPYGTDETFPTGEDYRRYLSEYQTRTETARGR